MATAQHRVSGILGFLIHNRLGSVRKNSSMKTGVDIQFDRLSRLVNHERRGLKLREYDGSGGGGNRIFQK